MNPPNGTPVTLTATAPRPAARVWELYVSPEHVLQWNTASPDWHCPHAHNDVRVGGSFHYRMEEKNGLRGFDFTGEYTEVTAPDLLTYRMPGGRRVTLTFDEVDGTTTITQTFEADGKHPLDMQRRSWQAILDNFARYVEQRG